MQVPDKVTSTYADKTSRLGQRLSPIVQKDQRNSVLTQETKGNRQNSCQKNPASYNGS